MKIDIKNYRGGVTLGLLAISLWNLSPRLLAQDCQSAGKLNRWEKRYDVNRDGQLDAQETAAMEAGRQEAFQRLLGKYDKDGDGRLNPEERQVAKAARKAEKEAQETKKG